MVVKTRLFRGKEYQLSVYNGQAIIDMGMRFYTKDCDGNEINFEFTDFESAYLRVYNERLGRQILELPLTQSGAYLVFNADAEDMNFDTAGNYYYEVGYVMSGGYEQALRYGNFVVI